VLVNDDAELGLVRTSAEELRAAGVTAASSAVARVHVLRDAQVRAVERVELADGEATLPLERVLDPAGSLLRLLRAVADRREERPGQRAVSLHLVEQPRRRQLHGRDSVHGLVEHDDCDVLAVGLGLIEQRFVCIVPWSSFDCGSNDESNVTQMSVWPVDSTNEVQCEAVRKMVGEISDPLHVRRKVLSLGRSRIIAPTAACRFPSSSP